MTCNNHKLCLSQEYICGKEPHHHSNREFSVICRVVAISQLTKPNVNPVASRMPVRHKFIKAEKNKKIY
jgi:hypothetical protein